MSGSNKGVSSDERLTVVFFLLFGLLLFDITNGGNFSFFLKNNENIFCKELRFVPPDKLAVENCLDPGRVPADVIVPARYAPLLFSAMPINNANIDMLMTVDGVGPVLAEDIVAYRRQFGFFTSSTDLLNLSGIGPKRADKFATVFSFAEVP